MFSNLLKISKRIVNSRNTLLQTIANHVVLYPTPINFSYAYSFGSLVGLFFALQLVTGIFLAMHYTGHTGYAFSSVVHIMVDVKNGYLFRYMHANGASMIFILIYIHIGRGLYYRSYIYNRRHLWWSGIIIFLLMMATAFIGYVLPWGQMSFWGATVITSLVTAVPFIGESIAYWVWGGFSVSNATLIRFFSLHYLLPFIITGIIFIHLILLHTVTSTNPAQVSSFAKMSFHPYFTFKDLFALTTTFLFFIILIYFYPNILGHSDNFIPANPLVTPPHIVPEWYFTPFYAILRSCPNKLGGVIFMLAAILILFVLPFYKIPANTTVAPLSNTHKILFWTFGAFFFILLFLGGKPATAPYVVASQFFTFAYFAYFVGFVTLIPLIEKGLIFKFSNEMLDYKGQQKQRVYEAKQVPQSLAFLFTSMKDLSEKLSTLYHLWPLSQWVLSLTTLILLYLITGHYYNKLLSEKGGWLKWSTRIWLVIVDLTLNLGLGLHYLDYRETAFGLFMLKCPIAVSPVIFILELVCLYIYRRWGIPFLENRKVEKKK